MTEPQAVVAVIDNDMGMRLAINALLRAKGYGVELYDSAERFLRAQPGSRASCLIVDVNLGDITGIELSRQLRADNIDVPTIFISGSKEEWVRRDATEIGCAAFVEKPFPARDLLEAVAYALSSAFGAIRARGSCR